MLNVTVKEFAILANDVYQEPSRFSQQKFGNWKPISSTKLYNPSYHSSFFARLYLRFQSDVVTGAVIAFRGTVLNHMSNLIDDIELALDRPPECLSAADIFYIKAVSYLNNNYRGIKPKLTGHSLGGAIAQLIAIESQQHPQTVVFNSPGIANVLDGNLRQQDHSYIHQFDLNLDAVHKIGHLAGSERSLKFQTADCPRPELALQRLIADGSYGMLAPLTETIGLTEVGQCAYSQHAMANMLSAINQDDNVAAQGF